MKHVEPSLSQFSQQLQLKVSVNFYDTPIPSGLQHITYTPLPLIQDACIPISGVGQLTRAWNKDTG